MKPQFITLISIFSGVLLLILISLIGIAIFLLSKPKLDETVRKELGGSYIKLSQGVTHYELIRPSKNAPLVVLIPGLTVPMQVYNHNFEALNRAGYSTLRYDFFGRGLSDRPYLKYTSAVYVQQTQELLDSLGITSPVHLIGISLGAAVAAEMVVKNPSRYSSLTMVGAAIAYSQDEADAKKRAVLADRFKVFNPNAKIDTTLDAYKMSPYIKGQFKYRGAEFSFLSLTAFESVYRYLSSYEQLAKIDSLPMQIIWGEKDDNFPLPLGQKLSKFFPKAEFHIVSGGGHTPHYGKAEVTNPLFNDFLNRVESDIKSNCAN